MSHLEKFDAVIHDKIGTAAKPTLTTPFIRLFADIKKLVGSLVFLFAGVLVLASCGSTTTTTSTATAYPNASLLVSGAALNVGAANQVIIDARSAADYAAGHITNAINIPLTTLNATAYTLDATTAVNALSAAGVSSTAKIIVYGADVDGNAGWLFWALEYLGATDVHMLDGGYTKWVADGRTVVTTPTTLTAATFTPTVNAARLATMADVTAHYADTTNYAIVDSRNAVDFVAGHIPNAINALIGDFLNSDKTVLSHTKLKSLLDFRGITAGKTVITHCYVGYRSAQEYFILRLMGFNVSNYDGSWTEWNAATAYPNAGLLVDKTALAGAVVIDARSAALYNAGHIPGAINVLHSDYWTAGTGLKATATLEAQLGAAGISPTSNIVIYDDTTASWGAAGRLFWMLEYLGASDVHILNGGWNKWVADVANTATTTATTLPTATFTASVQTARILSGAQIATKLGNANFAVIDARTDEEFNGWQLYGETRGGHIPGAYNIPYATFYNADKTTLSYQSLKQMFESRGITTDKEVTSYCTAGIRSGHVYFLLRLMGYTQASNYDASMFEWSADTTKPEEKAANFKDLVYPAWVNSLIAYHAPGSITAAPPEYKDAGGVTYDRTHKYLILENQWGITADQTTGYLAGHIPGAIHSDTDPWESGATDPLYSLLPDATLIAHAGELGITPDTTVVVYSNDLVFSARLWWLLKYLGVTDVRMLNGGYAAWTAAGYAGETAINNPVATTYSGTVNAAVIATTANVLSTYYTSASTQMVDVRSDREYLGTSSGYSYLDLMGRIPGALWAYDGSSASYADADGTLRSYTDVRSMWKDRGIQSTGTATLLDKDAVFYCGGGYRSGLAYFYAHLMGYTNIRNYADGWAGWSTVPSAWGTTQVPTGRPVASGTP
jgi:3-mercaptopyruvate sulfurtransferase SseA